jgi:hypothetical protein
VAVSYGSLGGVVQDLHLQTEALLYDLEAVKVTEMINLHIQIDNLSGAKRSFGWIIKLKLMST